MNDRSNETEVLTFAWWINGVLAITTAALVVLATAATIGLAGDGSTLTVQQEQTKAAVLSAPVTVPTMAVQVAGKVWQWLNAGDVTATAGQSNATVQQATKAGSTYARLARLWMTLPETKRRQARPSGTATAMEPLERTPEATSVGSASRRLRKVATRTASYHRINRVFGTLKLTITTGSKTEVFGYYVEDMPTEFGPTFRAFNLLKYEHQRKAGEPNAYDVMIDTAPVDAEKPRHSCECLGFLRWAKPCKHISSLVNLINVGKI